MINDNLLNCRIFSPSKGECPKSLPRFGGGEGVLISRKNYLRVILLFKIPPLSSPQRGEKNLLFQKHSANYQSLSPPLGGLGGKKRGNCEELVDIEFSTFAVRIRSL
jgi:hypothetical protein